MALLSGSNSCPLFPVQACGRAATQGNLNMAVCLPVVPATTWVPPSWSPVGRGIVLRGLTASPASTRAAGPPRSPGVCPPSAEPRPWTLQHVSEHLAAASLLKACPTWSQHPAMVTWGCELAGDGPGASLVHLAWL